MSSPVKLAGAGKNTTMPESIASPVASRKDASVAVRAAGVLPVMVRAMRRASGPATLTMPIPPRPGAVAMAAIVSGRVAGLLMDQFSRSICRVMTHCCDIDSRLFTSQYSTRPAGKNRKNTVKMIGMNCITFACMGSGGGGFSFCW